MSIFRTRDFTALAPTYEDVGGAISGAIKGMVLDPYTPRDAAYALTPSGFWRTRNLNDGSPGWGQTLDITTKVSAGLSPVLHKMQATIAYQGRLYAVGWKKVSPTATTYSQFVMRTDDGGSTWTTVYATGATTSGSGLFTLGQFPGVEIAAFGNVVNIDNFLLSASDCINFAKCNGDGYIIVDLGAPYNMTEVYAKGVEVGINAFTYIATGDTATGPWTPRWSARPHGGCDTWASFGAITEITTQFLYFTFQGFALGNYREYYCMGVNVSSGPTPVPITAQSALAVGQHDAAKVYVSDGAIIRRSVNSGATWATYIAQGANDIECPYAGNGADNNLVFIGADGRFYTTVGATATLRSAWGTESPVAVTGRIVTYTNDASTIYTLFHDGGDSFSVKRTTDGGSNWSTMSSGHMNARAIGLWPYNSAIVYMLTDDGPLYSLDGGATFANKLGNLSGWADQVYIVPVWIS